MSDLGVVDLLIVEAGKEERHYWRDIWLFRELFAFLTWRDVAVRYKQTFFGVAWAWLRPLFTLVTFVFVFGKLAKMPSGGQPYALLVFAGMLAWQFFSAAFAAAATSLVENANLVSKVYFPRLIVPSSAIAVCLVDLAVSMLLLLPMMFWYHVFPSINIWSFPFFVLLVFFLSLGLGLWTSALNVKYRDFRYIVPFLTQAGIFISPVGFSTIVVPGRWRLFYDLNPMVGIINGFRWSLLGAPNSLDFQSVELSVAMTILAMGFGLIYFRRTERFFADNI